MNSIHIWQLATDSLLVLALLYLCFRVVRSSTTSYDGSKLRSLMIDADELGRAMNERMLKRQTSLENLSFDLETIEHRIERLIASAEEAKLQLDASISKAHKRAETIARRPDVFASDEMQADSAQVDRPAKRPTPAKPEMEIIKSPDSDYEEAPKNPPSGPSRNIYGDPIPATAQPERTLQPEKSAPQSEFETISLTEVAKPATTFKAESAQPASLTASVEKERVAPTNEAAQKLANMQRLYDAAEELLRAGNDLRSVAVATKLPIDEVRVLSQLVAQEKAEQQQQMEADPRLGVLSGLKRSTETL